MPTALAGHYDIVKPLGGGAFGQTFLAKDYHLPGCPLVVVKQLKPKQRDPEVILTAKRLFEREADTLYRVGTHPQIPRLLAHFEQDGEFYLVQERIDGKSLDQEFIEGQPWSEADVVVLLQDILQVLAFVHQEQVIHRDIKPANLIRRAKDNKIVLIDFGAVKEVRNLEASNNRQPNHTVAIGSPGYMPIEQQLGNPHFSSDIYAIGILALQALTGFPPEELPSDPKTGEYHCAFLNATSSVSSGLVQILNKMVRRDYLQRYQDAGEALRAIQALNSGINNNNEAISKPCLLSSVQASCLEDPTGQVPLNSPFYVERSILETRYCQEIVKQAALLRIKAPLNMGKSSLLARILNHAENQGYRTVLVSLGLFDEETRSDLDQFLRQFCEVVSDELGNELDISPETIDAFWKSRYSPNVNCKRFFEKFLLPKLEIPLVLALDDVDEIFPNHGVAKEFLKLLREWHEKAKTSQLWAKLRMILAYSTDAYVVMDTNSSPFNVGLEVELREFTAEEVLNLASCHGLSWDSATVDRLMEVVGGHPYLIRVALYHVACQDQTLEQLLQDASTEAGIYKNHLRRHLQNLKNNPKLAAAMKAVVEANQPICLESEPAFKLYGLGLLRLQGNEATPRFELYRQYFGERLRDL